MQMRGVSKTSKNECRHNSAVPLYLLTRVIGRTQRLLTGTAVYHIRVRTLSEIGSKVCVLGGCLCSCRSGSQSNRRLVCSHQTPALAFISSNVNICSPSSHLHFELSHTHGLSTEAWGRDACVPSTRLRVPSWYRLSFVYSLLLFCGRVGRQRLAQG